MARNNVKKSANKKLLHDITIVSNFVDTSYFEIDRWRERHSWMKYKAVVDRHISVQNIVSDLGSTYLLKGQRMYTY